MNPRTALPLRLFLVAATFNALPLFAGDAPKPLQLFRAQEAMESLDTEIYPIGWTANGERFAYLAAEPNEAADERSWRVMLIDLVTDEAILNERLFQEQPGNIEDFWRVHGVAVEQFLAPHSIKRINQVEVNYFPALEGRFRSDSYEVTISRKYGEEPNFGYRGLYEFSVRVINGIGRTKTVFDETWPEWYPLAGGVIGYLMNPQGDRMAVVLAFTHRGYEGPPHIRRITITGVRIGEKF